MYYLGVDLGGTNIAAGLVSEQGRLLHKHSVPTHRKRECSAILADLSKLCLKVMEDNNVGKEQVKYIGVGSPGNCDSKKGIFTYSNNLPYNNTPVRDVVQEQTGLPVYIDNDANCAALAEDFAGAAKGYDYSLTVTLGTGVGSGIVMGGKIFTGAYALGPEMGHHTIQKEGEPCSCGRKGCWEAYASATALIRETKKLIEKNPSAPLAKLVEGDLDRVTAKTVFDAESQDPLAAQLIEAYLQDVAEGLANIVNMIEPQIIVIGGGVCAQGDRILVPLRKYVKERTYNNDLKTEFAIATLGNDAGIIGAALLGM